VRNACEKTRVSLLTILSSHKRITKHSPHPFKLAPHKASASRHLRTPPESPSPSPRTSYISSRRSCHVRFDEPMIETKPPHRQYKLLPRSFTSLLLLAVPLALVAPTAAMNVTHSCAGPYPLLLKTPSCALKPVVARRQKLPQRPAGCGPEQCSLKQPAIMPRRLPMDAPCDTPSTSAVAARAAGTHAASAAVHHGEAEKWWKKDSDLWIDVHTEEEFEQAVTTGDRLVFVGAWRWWWWWGRGVCCLRPCLSRLRCSCPGSDCPPTVPPLPHNLLQHQTSLPRGATAASAPTQSSASMHGTLSLRLKSSLSRCVLCCAACAFALVPCSSSSSSSDPACSGPSAQHSAPCQIAEAPKPLTLAAMQPTPCKQPHATNPMPCNQPHAMQPTPCTHRSASRSSSAPPRRPASSRCPTRSSTTRGAASWWASTSRPQK